MPTETQPYLILIFGPNGAGKTTFRKSILETNPNFANFISINWDEEIAKILKNTPNIDKTDAMLDGGKIVINKINTCLENKQDFIYESVATSKHFFKLLTRAKNYGFKIITVFISLSNVELSKLRVKSRVLQGGHDIPIQELEERFPKILSHLSTVLEKSDTCFVIDNSGKYFRPIFVKSDNFNEIFNKIPRYLSIIKNYSVLISDTEYNKQADSQQKLSVEQIVTLYYLRYISQNTFVK